MKTTRSAFSGFPRDRFTTLADTDDRLMATKITAIWRYGAPDVDVRRHLDRGPRDPAGGLRRPRQPERPDLDLDHGQGHARTTRGARRDPHGPARTSTTGRSTRRRSGMTNDKQVYMATTEPTASSRRRSDAARVLMAGRRGVEVTGPPSRASERVLTDGGARLRRRPAAAVRAARHRPLHAARSARRSSMPGAAGLPRRHPRGPRGRLDGRAGTGRPRRSAGRDHRSGRAEDDDQRPQLGRAGLHGRPRGRAVADVGQRHRRPGGDPRRGPRHARVRLARGQVVPARGAGRHARRPAARLASHRVARARRWHRRSRRRCSTPGCTCSTTPPSGWHAGPARTSTCPSSSRITRPGSGTRSSSSPQATLGDPARVDPGDRPHRDDPRGLRDGRDPVRAARARRGPQRGPLGLPVQRIKKFRAAPSWSCRTAPS